MATSKTQEQAGSGAGGFKWPWTIPVLAGTMVRTAADVPLGTFRQEVERVVRAKVARKPLTPRAFHPEALKRALRVGGAFGAGTAAGVVTFPMFTSGVKDLEEDRPKRGVAKLIAGTGLFAALAGALEYGSRSQLEGAVSDVSVRAAMRAGARAKVPLAVAQAVGTGLAMARKRKAQKSGDAGQARKGLVAMLLTGAALSGGRSALERTMYYRALNKGRLSRAALPAIIGAGAGGAAMGAGSILVFDKVIDAALGKSKK